VSETILLFVKYPTPGKVKTRLAATVGAEEATRIYRRMVEHICALLPQSIVPVVHFDPPERRLDFEQWLGPLLSSDAVFEPQVSGDLGARLREAFRKALGMHSAVAAIGTDCVEIDGAILRECHEALAQSDCVIGPASDGGYYLIALSRSCPELFEGVPWSTAETFEKTMEIASAAGLSVHLLPELHDVDTESDWKRAEATLASRP